MRLRWWQVLGGLLVFCFANILLSGVHILGSGEASRRCKTLNPLTRYVCNTPKLCVNIVLHGDTPHTATSLAHPRQRRVFAPVRNPNPLPEYVRNTLDTYIIQPCVNIRVGCSTVLHGATAHKATSLSHPRQRRVLAPVRNP